MAVVDMRGRTGVVMGGGEGKETQGSGLGVREGEMKVVSRALFLG